MSKIEDAELLASPVSRAFDGTELRLLANLLDDKMMDWTEERRAKYAPLYDDLVHLANRLFSNGHDYGWREKRRWADEPPESPPEKFVNVICGCGSRITIKIHDKGEPLYEWPVLCKNHLGRKGNERPLGTIFVEGIPGELMQAQLIAQQIIVHNEEDIANFDTHTFRANAKF